MKELSFYYQNSSDAKALWHKGTLEKVWKFTLKNGSKKKVFNGSHDKVGKMSMPKTMK